MNLLRNGASGMGVVFLVVVSFIPAGCGSSHAAAPQPIVSTPITQCGTVISTPGDYGITQSLTSVSATVDCIQISSPGVRLSIADSVSLTGPGGNNVTAAGVNILGGSEGVQLLVSSVTIQGFGVGIEVSGSGVAILGAPTGLVVTGNAAQGILVSNANNVLIEMAVSQKNGAAGLEVSGATGVTVQGLGMVQQNGGYGLWVHSSSGNQFFTLDAFNNQKDGIYVGEPTEGQNPSDDNVFVNAGTVQNSGAGIHIGLNDSHNTVTASTGQSNPGKDALDDNPNCGTNIWSGNNFATSSPSCIQ